MGQPDGVRAHHGTEVRLRVTREHLGRRGTNPELVWVNRRMLLTGTGHLPAKQWQRLWTGFDQRNDPKKIQAAWAVKERLPMLLRSGPSKPRWALADIYQTVLDAHMPEATRHARHDRTVVARHLGRAHQWQHECPDPGVQPDLQSDQTGGRRLRRT